MNANSLLLLDLEECIYELDPVLENTQYAKDQDRKWYNFQFNLRSFKESQTIRIEGGEKEN